MRRVINNKLRENRARAALMREFRQFLLEKKKKDAREPGEDSLDDQVDKFLVDYESEAKLSKTEGLDFRSMTRRFLLEAEDDEEDKKDEDEEEEKVDKEDEEDESEDKKLELDELDMSSYVRDVMRLVDNYDSLLEVRNTILRRAVNYVSDRYEPDAVEAFKEELLESYGIEIGRSDADKEDEFQAPKAGAAGPMGGGGA